MPLPDLHAERTLALVLLVPIGLAMAATIVIVGPRPATAGYLALQVASGFTVWRLVRRVWRDAAVVPGRRPSITALLVLIAGALPGLVLLAGGTACLGLALYAAGIEPLGWVAETLPEVRSAGDVPPVVTLVTLGLAPLFTVLAGTLGTAVAYGLAVLALIGANAAAAVVGGLAAAIAAYVVARRRPSQAGEHPQRQ